MIQKIRRWIQAKKNERQRKKLEKYLREVALPALENNLAIMEAAIKQIDDDHHT